MSSVAYIRFDSALAYLPVFLLLCSDNITVLSHPVAYGYSRIGQRVNAFPLLRT